ncbi:MAG: D-alanyl-D-alanine carboxypeptidase [Clostridia bacterium]|nr:D-alanyl-D-alanine carboxypeptidase [Clostridia bacterium]
MKKLLISICCVLCVCIAPICSGFFVCNVFAETEICVDATAGFLVDYFSGEVLFEQKADEKLQIASMAKLMTIYLVLEELDNGNIKLEDNLVATQNASSMGGSQVFLDANSKYSIQKMLESVIMASANDASVALAEHISGSEENFVKKMNSTAQRLGMTNTLYANSTGLPAPMQYSTARDCAKILSAIIPNETYHLYSSVWMDELVHPSGRKTEIVNTNRLTRYYEGCDSGKTGFTDEAGFCLASSVHRENMRLVGVVIGAKNSKERFNQSVKLFNFGFANFANEQILSTETELATLPVKRSQISQTKVFASQDFYGLVKKGEDNEWSVSTEIDKSVTAPQKAGDKVGTATITKNGVIVKEIDIVLNQNIDALTFNQSFKKIVEKW